MSWRLSLGWFIAGLLMVVLLSQAWAQPSGQTFLPNEVVLQEIADGRAWRTERAQEEGMSLTLRADGTGQMTGKRGSMAITWRFQEEGLCLRLIMGMRKCMRFVRSENGFVGYESPTSTVRLFRPANE
jgi:hypothetical protein